MCLLAARFHTPNENSLMKMNLKRKVTRYKLHRVLHVQRVREAKTELGEVE